MKSENRIEADKLEGSPLIRAMVKSGNNISFACVFNDKENLYLVPKEIMEEKYILELIKFYEDSLVIEDMQKNMFLNS